MIALERLHLAYNSISSLVGFQDFDGKTNQLQILELYDNRISDLEEIKHLKPCVMLKELTLKQSHLSNPVCSDAAYPAVIAATLGESIALLDGESLVAHLSRMADIHHMILRKPSRSDLSTAAHGKVVIPTKQLKEVFPQETKGTTSRRSALNERRHEVSVHYHVPHARLVVISSLVKTFT